MKSLSKQGGSSESNLYGTHFSESERSLPFTELIGGDFAPSTLLLCELIGSHLVSVEPTEPLSAPL